MGLPPKESGPRDGTSPRAVPYWFASVRGRPLAPRAEVNTYVISNKSARRLVF